MNILLASATEFEVDFANINHIVTDKNVLLTKLITGVGVPNAMYHLTKAVLTNKHDFIIQAGIGGTTIKNFELGNVVIIGADTFADVGIYEKGEFSTLFDNGFADKNKVPYKDGWLRNNNILDIDLPHYISVTVNTITDDKAVIANQNKLFNAGVESMEGAALHFVCLMHNIPFLQVRSISNVVGERDKSKWQIKKAISNLNKALPNIINSIIKSR